MKAVLQVLNGTWSPSSSSTTFKICSGGEIDTAAKLKPFTQCQIISGTLKFFIPIDFSLGVVFAGLIAVSGDVVFYNTGLKQLTKAAFPKLEALGGSILIAHNTDLTNVDGLQTVHAVRGGMNINNNAKLKQVTLAGLQHIHTKLEVTSNPTLENVALPKLKAAGEISFDTNHQLRSFAIPLLHSVDGKFGFKQHNQVNKVAAPELQRIGNNFELTYNNALDLIEMPKLAIIGGGFSMRGINQLDLLSMPKLSLINGAVYMYDLDRMEYISMPELSRVDGSVEMQYCNMMVSISMPKLLEVDGQLAIRRCNKLSGLEMPLLTQVSGNFALEYNQLLGSISDFHQLSTIKGSLSITNNKQLQCIKGLSNVSAVEGALSIRDNTKLFMCNQLYAKLRNAARSVDQANTFVKRDDCNHVCSSAEVRQDCIIGGFGNWSECAAVCGPATQFRSQAITTPATNGGRCEKKTEAKTCPQNRFNSPCTDTVSKILAGQWQASMGSTQKVCTGGEIDAISQLARYNNCEIIAGHLKFFISADVDFVKIQTFSSLLAVSGDVVFFGTEIREIGASVFPQLQVVGGKVLFGHNTELVSVKGFRSLHTVGSDFKIERNEKLLDVEAMSVAKIQGNLQLLENQKLVTSSMPNLASIKGELRFSGNSEMKVIEAPQLQTIGTILYLYQCNQVQSVSMPRLTNIGGDMRLQMDQVKTISLPLLTVIAGSTAQVRENYQMQSMDLKSLSKVNGNFYVINNNQLKAIVFPKLSEVKGQLEINYNHQSQLISMPTLTKIKNNLQVNSNNRLLSISMPDLTETGSSFTISNNQELSALKEFGQWLIH